MGKNDIPVIDEDTRRFFEKLARMSDEEAKELDSHLQQLRKSLIARANGTYERIEDEFVV